jgi:hypothetical protein
LTSKRPTLSAAGKLNVIGMVAAAVGIIMQIASGSDLYPTIPPGPIILLAGAALVALGPWRWTPVVGVVVPLFLLVGAVIAAVVSGEFVDQLTDPGEVGIFAGDVLQLLGVIIALVAGIVALRQSAAAAGCVGRPAHGRRSGRAGVAARRSHGGTGRRGRGGGGLSAGRLPLRPDPAVHGARDVRGRRALSLADLPAGVRACGGSGGRLGAVTAGARG